MPDYYAGRAGLDAMIADVDVPIHEVVAEVDRLCRRDAHAAIYYREHPELLYTGHPWVTYVESGGAQWVGWEPAHA